ncbi:MAG: HIT family protein [Armatimonadota bacterium]
MNHLWAPWRMGYVTKGGVPSDCVFCECGHCDPATDAEHNVLARANHNYIILNAYPYNNGHLMVVPYQHESDFTKLPPHTAMEMIALAQLALAVLQQEYRAEGANIGLNIGKAAGAGIKDHVHMHVVPRWSGDTNFMTALAETRVVPQSLADCYCTLAPAMREFVEKYLSQMLAKPE